MLDHFLGMLCVLTEIYFLGMLCVLTEIPGHVVCPDRDLWPKTKYLNGVADHWDFFKKQKVEKNIN
jgi:hypothetical protein